MRIGICDWGIGGLGFYQILRAARPDLDVIYLGDQGVPGYGKLTKTELTIRMTQVTAWFEAHGVAELVVACNAASTVLPEVRRPGLRITGMIAPTVASLVAGPSGKVGVIGGRRTIVAGAYRRPLQAAGFEVRQRVAQPLSGLIESGLSESPETMAVLDRVLRPLRGSDRLILACTHYIVLEQEIRNRLPQATLVDPARLAYEAIVPTLPLAVRRTGQSRFFTTGDPVAMQHQAEAAFGVSTQVDRTEVVTT